MRVLRTPDERFVNLPDYSFQPHYLTVKSEEGTALRMHYVDEGKGSPVVLLHGEPSWSYLYRKMVRVFAAAGRRALAPDLIGFGRSDKPAAVADYTYARHVQWVADWLQQLDVRDATLVCQDWGSLIGLRLAAEHGERFSRIVVANGFLPTADRPTPPAFYVWRTFALYSPVLPVGRIVSAGCVSKPTPAVRAAYDAPYPSAEYQAGARAFPALVPTSPEDPAVPANRAAWEKLGRWEKPFLTLFGKNDPILGAADRPLQRHVPGAAGQPHQRFWGGHFVQEDRGEFLAHTILDWKA